MPEPITTVDLKLTGPMLQTLKMAIAALQLQASVLEAALDAAVKEQLMPPATPPEPPP